MKLLTFVKYNNAVPIVISLVLLSAGGVFAAGDPSAILSQSSQVVSPDNTYIANKDLSTYTPQIQITGVTEDADNYYIAYTFSTIDIQNYVWQDVTKDETLTVSKQDLGGEDLGTYATGQFKNIIANELAYLGQVQLKARQDTTQETVATTYGGLVGKMLTDNTQTLPGYTPVVTSPAPSDTNSDASTATNSASSASVAAPEPASASSALLSLQILGDNPATLSVGDSYADLGVVLVDSGAPNLGYHIYVDGIEETSPIVDTRTPGTHTVEYRAVDQAGTTVSAIRTVNIVDPNATATSTPVSVDASSTPATSTQPQ